MSKLLKLINANKLADKLINSGYSVCGIHYEPNDDCTICGALTREMEIIINQTLEETDL